MYEIKMQGSNVESTRTSVVAAPERARDATPESRPVKRVGVKSGLKAGDWIWQ